MTNSFEGDPPEIIPFEAAPGIPFTTQAGQTQRSSELPPYTDYDSFKQYIYGLGIKEVFESNQGHEAISEQLLIKIQSHREAHPEWAQQLDEDTDGWKLISDK
jgi:hypothetical protein